MASPTYFPEAVPTRSGWANPLTGEQLDVASGLNGAVAYYKPNSGKRSFIDPAGSTKFLGFAVVRARKAKVKIHTLKVVTACVWDFGDGSPTYSSKSMGVGHIYPRTEEDTEYTITATITYLNNPAQPNGATTTEPVEIDILVQGYTTQKDVTALTLNPAGPLSRAVGTQAVTVTATFEDNTTAPVTTGVVWTSSNSARATVTGTGPWTINALSAGTANLTATYRGESKVLAITVT